MLTNKTVRVAVILLLLLSNLGCDQISKTIVRVHLSNKDQLHFLDDRVMLTRVENPGAFLSVGRDLSLQGRFLLLIIVPLIALAIAFSYLFFKSDLSRRVIIGSSFVIGGGLGNIYDRYAYGAVTDFVHINLGVFKTGIFNLADVSIMVGALIVLSAFLLSRTSLHTPSAS